MLHPGKRMQRDGASYAGTITLGCRSLEGFFRVGTSRSITGVLTHPAHHTSFKVKHIALNDGNRDRYLGGVRKTTMDMQADNATSFTH